MPTYADWPASRLKVRWIPAPAFPVAQQALLVTPQGQSLMRALTVDEYVADPGKTLDWLFYSVQASDEEQGMLLLYIERWLGDVDAEMGE